ncbi:MAG TPA: hypothetical protein GX406_09035 [Pseudoclavibacter sp.]|nr:hypothetical protein [Pseudoclavibacter sp.]
MPTLDERFDTATRELHHHLETAIAPTVTTVLRRHRWRRTSSAIAAGTLACAGAVAVGALATRDGEPASDPPAAASPPSTLAPYETLPSTAGVNPTCLADTADARSFFNSVTADIGGLGWNVTALNPPTTTTVDNSAPPVTFPIGPAFGETTHPDDPDARLFEAHFNDDGRRLLVAITTGLDVAEIQSGRPDSEVLSSNPDATTYVGTDSNTARAAETYTHDKVIYVRSEVGAISPDGNDSARSLQDLTALAATLTTTNWNPTGQAPNKATTATCGTTTSSPGTVPPGT